MCRDSCEGDMINLSVKVNPTDSEMTGQRLILTDP